jgi:predicted nucleic acid-binding protein
MKLIVLDASVAAKWYIREINSELAQRLLDGDFSFLVPDIFLAEVATAVRKQHREHGQLNAADVRAAINDFLTLGIQPISSAILLPRAIEASLILDHPVYDCLYLSLAERSQKIAVTADKRLCEKVEGSEWADRVLLLSAAERIF